MHLQRTILLFFMLYGLLFPAYAEEKTSHDFSNFSLKVDVNSLKTAKKNKNFWSSKQKKLQSQLEKLEKNSDPWFTIFWDLQNANIELDQWKGEQQRISRLLPSLSKITKLPEVALSKVDTKEENKEVDKTLSTKKEDKKKAVIIKETIKTKTNPVVSDSKAPPAPAEKIDEALGDSHETSYEEINSSSSSSLVERLKAEVYSANLKTSRVETQLKKTRKVVLKLRSTLRVAAKAIRQQKQENEQMTSRLKELSPSDALLSAKEGAKKIKLENLKPKKPIEPVNVDKVADSIKKETQQQSLTKPVIAATAIKTSLKKSAPATSSTTPSSTTKASLKNKPSGRQKGIDKNTQKSADGFANSVVNNSLNSVASIINTLELKLMSFPLFVQFDRRVNGKGLLVGAMVALILLLLPLLLLVSKRRKKRNLARRNESKRKSKALDKKFAKNTVTKESQISDGLALQKTG